MLAIPTPFNTKDCAITGPCFGYDVVTVHKSPISGIILAGGRSTRMGGRDKALTPLRGEPLLRHLLRRLQPQTHSLAINSNNNPEDFAAFGLPVIADRLTGFQGPLAGLHAGLNYFPESLVLAVSVDSPFIPRDLASRLQAGLTDRLCACASNGSQHALALLCRPEAAKRIQEYLECGGRNVRDFLAAEAVFIHFDRPDDRGLFVNLNTPEDMAHADADAALWND